jgi:hypothetical protein
MNIKTLNKIPCLLLKGYWTMTLATILLLSWDLVAQMPQGFSYQAVIRNENGDILVNQNVTMRFSIWHLDSPESFTAYQETITLTTNEFGLIEHIVGTGTPTIGAYSAVDWNSDIPFPWQMRTEVNVGNGYVDLGSRFFQTVPYAEAARDTWSMNGNANSSSDKFIGTTDNNGFTIKTNDISRVFIDSYGSSKFYGDVRFYESITTGNASIEYNENIYYDDDFYNSYINELLIDAGYGNQLKLTTGVGLLNMDFWGNIVMDHEALQQIPGPRMNILRGKEAAIADQESGFLVLGDVSGVNLLMDNNEINSRNNGSVGDLYLNPEGGKVGINTAGSTVQANLHVKGGSDAELNVDASGYFILGDVGGSNIVMDNNEIICRNNGLENELYLQAEGGGVVINSATSTTYSLLVNGTAAKPGGGSWTATSDARLKENVEPYSAGLKEVMKIEPVTYHYIENTGHDTRVEHVGVIAQEIQKIAPDMVTEVEMELSDGTKGDYLSVDPSAFTYMLINAIQELKKENEELKARIIAIEANR